MPHDSSLPWIAELGFVVAASSASDARRVGTHDVVTIPAHEFLQSIVVEASSEGSWTATVELFDAQGEYLENLILSTRGTRRFLFRWGWDNGNGLDGNPQFLGGINTYVPKFTPEGVGISLQMTFDKALDAVLDRRIRSYPEGTKPSKIATDIARERGWLGSDFATAPTIETDDKPITFPLSWSGQSDLFILNELVGPRINTVTSKGKAYSWYFDTSGALHFHSAAFVNQKPAKSYRYARDASGDVISFEPEEANISAAMLGGGEAIWKGSNSNAGTRQEDKTTGDKAPKGATIVSQDDATHRPDLGVGTKASILVPSRDKASFEAAVQAQFDRMRNTLVKANMTVVGTHEVRVGEYVEVVCTTKSGLSHYLAGKYRVNKLKQNLNSGGWTTDFELQRPGHQYADNAIKTNADSTEHIEVETASPTSSASAAINTEHRIRK